MNRLRRDASGRPIVDYSPRPPKRERPQSRWMIDRETGRRVARPRPPEPAFIVGMDIGQAADFTAIVALARDPDNPEGFIVPMIERIRGLPYTRIVPGLVELLAQPPLAGAYELVMDATGVGRPVVDMVREAGLDPLALTITGAAKVTLGHRRAVSVPKADLIEGLLVASQNGTVKIAAGLPHAETLLRELADLRRKITAAGNSRYGAREGEHDDLVLALAIAFWRVNRKRSGPGVIRLTTIEMEPRDPSKDLVRRKIADAVQ